MRQAAIDFVVRSVRRSDLPRCVVMDRLTHSEPWRLSDYRKARGHEDTLVLVSVLPAQYEFGEELIGCCVATIDQGELCFQRIAVHPEWQRCGVGSAMFSLACRNLDHSKVWALVPRDSRPHVEFWSGIGFSNEKRESQTSLDVYGR